MNQETVDAIARIGAAIQDVIKAETEKVIEKEKDGVIARPGDILTHLSDLHIVLRYGHSKKEINTLWLQKAGPDTYVHRGNFTFIIPCNTITTINGRPVIGFRDNDE